MVRKFYKVKQKYEGNSIEKCFPFIIINEEDDKEMINVGERATTRRCESRKR